MRILPASRHQTLISTDAETDSARKLTVIRHSQPHSALLLFDPQKEEIYAASESFLRHVSGCDRVAAGELNGDNNLVVVRETKSRSIGSALNVSLHTGNAAHSSIIYDFDQSNLPIFSARSELAELNFSLAASRAIGEVDRLARLGARASMALPIGTKKRFWEMLLLHHTSPKKPSPRVRQVLECVMPFLSRKVETLGRPIA